MNKSKPNVLLISVDDMNDWVGCINGYAGASTPNIDALAKRGVLFRNAHCPSPLCNPSRTSILTGLPPHVSGIYDNSHWWRPALPDIDTLPSHFRKNGYTTIGAGKVFHHTDGFNPPDQWNSYFDQIFDDPWDRIHYQKIKDMPRPEWHPLNGLKPFCHEHDWGPISLADAAYGDMQAIKWAENFLEQKQKKPFLLALGTFKPHIPWYAPQRFFDRYPKKQLPMPVVLDSDIENLPPVAQKLAEFSRDRFESMVDGGEWENAVQAYLACISFADEMIGRLVSALDASPHADNTIIVFYSDNGYHLGEKQHFTKCTLWERSTHVPFIIVPPRKNTFRPFAIDAPVSLQSIYQTLVDCCQLPQPPQRIYGETLAPLLDNPLASLENVALTTYLPENHAIRVRQWRYIHYCDGGEELYHTSEDPEERYNLSKDPSYNSIKRELANMLPKENADPVPGKTAYNFDLDSYSWKYI